MPTAFFRNSCAPDTRVPWKLGLVPSAQFKCKSGHFEQEKVEEVKMKFSSYSQVFFV